MENGLEKSQTVTKTVFWLNIWEICDQIMVPKIMVTKFIGPKVHINIIW